MTIATRPSPFKVRYRLRSVFSPLLLAACVAELSGLGLLAGVVYLPCVFLSILIAIRPYLEVINAELFHVGLFTGKRQLVLDPEAFLLTKGLGWIVKKKDRDKLKGFWAGTAAGRTGAATTSGVLQA